MLLNYITFLLKYWQISAYFFVILLWSGITEVNRVSVINCLKQKKKKDKGYSLENVDKEQAMSKVWRTKGSTCKVLWPKGKDWDQVRIWTLYSHSEKQGSWKGNLGERCCASEVRVQSRAASETSAENVGCVLSFFTSAMETIDCNGYPS